MYLVLRVARQGLCVISIPQIKHLELGEAQRLDLGPATLVSFTPDVGTKGEKSCRAAAIASWVHTPQLHEEGPTREGDLPGGGGLSPVHLSPGPGVGARSPGPAGRHFRHEGECCTRLLGEARAEPRVRGQAGCSFFLVFLNTQSAIEIIRTFFPGGSRT